MDKKIDLANEVNIDFERYKLEKYKARADIIKWIIIAVGAAVSFAVIDFGKLRLEREKALSEKEQQLLNSYMLATDAPIPDVWKRKLNLILQSTNSEKTRIWAENEFKYIEEFAELDTLYRETLRVASQLVEPVSLSNPERIHARIRYNQLYWADLPYAGESQQVISAMIAFRTQLIAAEADESDQELWNKLNGKLITLSRALSESSPKQRIHTTREGE